MSAHGSFVVGAGAWVVAAGGLVGGCVGGGGLVDGCGLVGGSVGGGLVGGGDGLCPEGTRIHV